MTDAALSVATVREVCLDGPGHYLGNEQTLRLMQTEYFYPAVGDRFSPKEWNEKGRPDILSRAIAEKKRILAGRFPRHVPKALDDRLRARFGDLIRLPMGIPHGLFNKSEQTMKCLFWVTPTRKLYDLFWAIHSMKEQKPEDVVALSAKHEVVFLPPPG